MGSSDDARSGLAGSGAADVGAAEVYERLAGSPYYSADLAPTTPAERRWRLKDFAVLWISMSACIPTYMLASSLVNGGMDWRQAVATIFLGNVIVLAPMLLNAHAGAKYGISFPVYCRASFGLRGANVPALLRALVACGWFGIQTWIGGQAIYVILTRKAFFPSLAEAPPLFADPNLPGSGWGVNGPQLGCFLFFWLINMAVVLKGIESIRLLLSIKAPLLVALGLALLAWAYQRAGGFGEMLARPSQFAPGGPKEGEFWNFFVLALTGNVSFWSTLALNIPDFSRYTRSQRDQALGQALGLPTTMGLYSFIGVAVTSAALVIYKGRPGVDEQKLWDPVYLLSLFDNTAVLVAAMLSLCLATLATNIAANVVSPANDFAHLWPRAISFRIGGLITGVVGILVRPWRLLENAAVYIDKWLVGYSLLLGAVGGVLIADYIVLRRTRIDVAGLYQKHGPYWYVNGINPLALAALLLGIGLCLPGWLATLGVVALDSDVGAPSGLSTVPAIFGALYNYAWFTSFGAAFVAYLALMNTAGKKWAP
jgi:NCS1 family nucleobase:cation symporter-1